MGACEPFLSPFFPNTLALPLESNLTICERSSSSIFVLSSLDFLDVEFPLDEDILEAMITGF
jgi:hypothetical protein